MKGTEQFMFSDLQHLKLNLSCNHPRIHSVLLLLPQIYLCYIQQRSEQNGMANIFLFGYAEFFFVGEDIERRFMVVD